MFEKIRENIDVFQPYFMERNNIDLAAELDRRFKNNEGLDYFSYHKFITANMPQDVLGMDKLETAEERGMLYIDKCGPIHRVPNIKKPTMFLNSLNDPFISATLDKEVFTKNPNTVLATNEYPGHLGYHESLFSLDQWFAAPVIDFLDGIES